MTEEGTVDDPDPRTAPRPQPGDKPQGEPRDFPHVRTRVDEESEPAEPQKQKPDQSREP
jgi:hypothetical protein